MRAQAMLSRWEGREGEGGVKQKGGGFFFGGGGLSGKAVVF